MKLLTTTAVLAACLFGPASALAVSADAQPQPYPAAAAQSSSLGAGPASGSTAVVDLRSPDAQQPVTPGVQRPAATVQRSSSPVSASPSSSDFEWTDAALGAGTMLALALLALGAFVLTGTARRHRSTV